MSEDFVQPIISGRKGSTEAFYKKYASRIFRYINRRASVEDAKEILNDTFLDAIDNIYSLKNNRAVEPFLYKIARSRIADFYRKKKLKLLLLKLPFLEAFSREIDRPDFLYEKNILRSGIERTFHRISKRYRTILELRYEQDISVKEISKILHLTFKATESLLFRARKNFKSNYENGGIVG